MAGTTTDDDARWADALSLLERTPTESAAQRLRRARRLRWLFVASLLLVTLALGAIVALLLIDPSTDHDTDVPTWRAVAGFSICGLGLLVAAVALVIQFRGLRRAGVWRSPLHVLRFGQRRELLRQVRGRGPDVPERIPLARHMAEVLLTQRLALPVQAGLLLNFAGLWIADPRTYRLVLIVVLGAVLLGAGIAFRRENRRARRYLAEHPAVEQDRRP